MGQAPVAKSCSDYDCACSNDAYTDSGLGGAMSGLLGMVGAGGFFNSLNQAPLTKAQNDLKNVQTYWSKIVNCLQSEIEDERFEEIKSSEADSLAQNKLALTTLGFYVKVNSLLIGMLCVLVFFLIVYDLSVPLPPSK